MENIITIPEVLTFLNNMKNAIKCNEQKIYTKNMNEIESHSYKHDI